MPIGFAPWYLQHSASQGRVVRFLGSGEVCSDYLAILCRPEDEDRVAAALAEWLIRAQGGAASRSPTGDTSDCWDLLELLGVDGGSYLSSLESAIVFSDDVLGSLLKSLVFGILVGLVSTYRGYTSAPTAAGVSASTTGTVVVASVWTLIIDYFITALWGV